MVSLLRQPSIPMPDWSSFLANRFKTTLSGQSQDAAESGKNLLARVPLFADLSEIEQQIIINQMQVQQFKPGDIIFSKNDESHCLYLITAGRVNLLAEDQQTIEDIIHSDELLGQTEFLLKHPRSQTAKAVEMTSVLFLDEPTLTSIVTTYPNIGVQLGLALGRGIVQFHSYLANQISGVALLGGLSNIQRRILAQYLTPYRCQPQDFIYRTGDPPTGIFFIELGEVLQFNETDEESTVLSVGDAFGERAVIYGTPHAFSAQALSDVTLWLLSPADFASLAEISPSTAAAISHNSFTALTEALFIATKVIDDEISALSIVSGERHTLVKELRKVRRTLSWIKHNQIAA